MRRKEEKEKNFNSLPFTSRQRLEGNWQAWRSLDGERVLSFSPFSSLSLSAVSSLCEITSPNDNREKQRADWIHFERRMINRSSVTQRCLTARIAQSRTTLKCKLAEFIAARSMNTRGNHPFLNEQDMEKEFIYTFYVPSSCARIASEAHGDPLGMDRDSDHLDSRSMLDFDFPRSL